MARYRIYFCGGCTWLMPLNVSVCFECALLGRDTVGAITETGDPVYLVPFSHLPL